MFTIFLFTLLANATCFDGLRPRLEALQRSSSEALRSFEEASRRGALAIDGMSRGVKAFRKRNCTELRALLQETEAILQQQLVTGSGRDELLFRRGYLFFRLNQCSAQNLRTTHAEQLWDADSARELYTHLQQLEQFRIALEGDTPLTGRTWHRWLAARTGVNAALSPIVPLLQEIRAACPETPAPRTLVTRPNVPIEPVPAEYVAPAPEPPTRPELTPEQRRTLLLRIQSLRNEQRRRQARLERAERARIREESRPAVLPSRGEINRRTRAAFEHALSHDGQTPEGFDWALTRLADDARSARPRITRGKWREMQTRWENTIRRMQEIARSEGNRKRVFMQAMNELAIEYFSCYLFENAGVIQAFQGRCTNCQGVATLILAVIKRVPRLVPPGFVPGLQVYSNHVQLTLVPENEEDHHVWDVFSNSTLDFREAPVYRLEHAFNAFLLGRGVRTGISQESLLIRAHDPSQEAPVTDSLNELASTMNNGQAWGESAIAFTRSRATPGERVAQDPPMIDESRQTERAERRTIEDAFRYDPENPPSDGALFQDYTLEVLSTCSLLSEISVDCRSSPRVRAAIDRIQSRTEAYLANPESLVRAINAGEIHPYNIFTLSQYYVGASSGYTLRNISRSSPSPSGMLRSFTPITDENPAIGLLRYLMDPNNVAPDRDLSEYLHERLREGNVPTGGPTHDQPARTQRTLDSTLLDELDAQYTLPSNAYQELAQIYVEDVTVDLENRKRAYRTLLSLVLQRGPPPTSGNSFIQICGDRFIEYYTGASEAVFHGAEALSPDNPQIFCPPGSPSRLTPAQEYQEFLRRFRDIQERLRQRAYH